MTVLSDFLRTNGLQAARKSYKLVPQRFAAIRTIRGASQPELARMIGCTPGHLSHVESGRNGMSLPLLVVALAILDVSVDALGVEL